MLAALLRMLVLSLVNSMYVILSEYNGNSKQQVFDYREQFCWYIQEIKCFVWKKIPSDDHFNKKVKLFHFISNTTQNNL